MPEETETAPDLLLTRDEIQAVTQKAMPASIAESLAIMATRAVRDYCGWRVAKPAEEQFVLNGRGGKLLMLPSMHVTAVGGVWAGGDQLRVDDQYDWDDTGVLERVSGRWPTKRRGVEVHVTHGYDECPGAIAQAIAASVARGSLTPAHGVTGETTLSQSIQYSRAASGAAAGSIFLPHELATLDAFRIPRTR